MLEIQDIRADSELVNRIDWSMTPEKAVSLYLEWGNNWNHGIDMIKSPEDVSHYFVVYSWEDGPVVHFVRRDTQGAEELAVIQLPEELRQRFNDYWGGHKGVYALTEEIQAWLKDQLGVDHTIH